MRRHLSIHQRRNRFGLGVALAVILIAALVYATSASHGTHHKTTHTGAANVPVYGPQPDRNADWTGPYPGDYTNGYIDKLAQNVGYEVLNSYSSQVTIQDHFADARRLVAAGERYDNDLGVFEYFNASFMYQVNLTRWRPYVNSFSPSWYLDDYTGAPITYKSGSPLTSGYVLDLTNPAYRAWAVGMLVDWMKAAPYKGVLLDSADQVVGTGVWSSLGNGTTSWNDLLCPPDAPVDGNGDCSRVVAWNDGLADFVSEVTAALHQLGDEVIFDGIAPSPLRQAPRNLDMAENADIAANESFCYVDDRTQEDPTFEPFGPDIQIMRQLAAEGKGVLEITDHRASATKEEYADYCLAGFMMGWQPGSDYYVYHASYADPLAGPYPEVREQDLELGLPVDAGYSTQDAGDVLYRQFQHGWVALNTGPTPAGFTIPVAAAEFSDGSQIGSAVAGGTVELPGRSAMFFLDESYLHPAAGGSTPGGG
jgi:Hypothetical glycosyl hydrolase family 15